MTNQKLVFLESEGNAWYERNKAYYQSLAEGEDDVLEFSIAQGIKPTRVLEIGCADGRRLDIFQRHYGAVCHGVDVSANAIEQGSTNYPNIHLSQAAADQLVFEEAEFDLVIIGFCLYLCDRADLFQIAASVDKVLQDGGHIIIKDFHPTFPYKRKYAHLDGLYSYKMDYAQLFSWNPSYTVLAKNITSHYGLEKRTEVDERFSYQLLYKNIDQGYPELG